MTFLRDHVVDPGLIVFLLLFGLFWEKSGLWRHKMGKKSKKLLIWALPQFSRPIKLMYCNIWVLKVIWLALLHNYPMVFYIRNLKFTFCLVAEVGDAQILPNDVFCDSLDPTDKLNWDSAVSHEKSVIVPTLVKENSTSSTNTSYIPFIPIGTLESHERKMAFISLFFDKLIWNFR